MVAALPAIVDIANVNTTFISMFLNSTEIRTVQIAMLLKVRLLCNHSP